MEPINFAKVHLYWNEENKLIPNLIHTIDNVLVNDDEIFSLCFLMNFIRHIRGIALSIADSLCLRMIDGIIYHKPFNDIQIDKKILKEIRIDLLYRDNPEPEGRIIFHQYYANIDNKLLIGRHLYNPGKKEFNLITKDIEQKINGSAEELASNSCIMFYISLLELLEKDVKDKMDYHIIFFIENYYRKVINIMMKSNSKLNLNEPNNEVVSVFRDYELMIYPIWRWTKPPPYDYDKLIKSIELCRYGKS